MIKPPAPTDQIRFAFGIAKSGYRRPLEPVAPEVERQAIEHWLASNEPKRLPPGFAIGAEPRHTVGFSNRARNRDSVG